MKKQLKLTSIHHEQLSQNQLTQIKGGRDVQIGNCTCTCHCFLGIGGNNSANNGGENGMAATGPCTPEV